MLRRTQVTAMLGAFAVSALAANARGANDVLYTGGPVISNVKVVEVYWGANVDATVQTTVVPFWQSIVDSPYLDWLGEYDTVGLDGGSNQRIRRGSFAGAVTITPSNVKTTITVAEVSAELQAQIASKVLPAPEVDAQGNANTLFAVDFPQGITLDDGTGNKSCAVFCSIAGSIPSGSTRVPFLAVPYLNGACAGGCGGNNYQESLTIQHSQGLLNLITAPQLDQTSGRGWEDPSQGAIGYLCLSTTSTLASYKVQAGWSDRHAQCIVSDPNLPLCDGTKHPCRPCSPASGGDGGAPDCTGAKAACDTTPGNPNQGLCVQCASDTDCGSGKVCDRQTDTLRRRAGRRGRRRIARGFRRSARRGRRCGRRGGRRWWMLVRRLTRRRKHCCPALSPWSARRRSRAASPSGLRLASRGTKTPHHGQPQKDRTHRGG